MSRPNVITNPHSLAFAALFMDVCNEARAKADHPALNMAATAKTFPSLFSVPVPIGIAPRREVKNAHKLCIGVIDAHTGKITRFGEVNDLWTAGLHYLYDHQWYLSHAHADYCIIGNVLENMLTPEIDYGVINDSRLQNFVDAHGEMLVESQPEPEVASNPPSRAYRELINESMVKAREIYARANAHAPFEKYEPLICAILDIQLVHLNDWAA